MELITSARLISFLLIVTLTKVGNRGDLYRNIVKPSEHPSNSLRQPAGDFFLCFLLIELRLIVHAFDSTISMFI